MQKIVFKKQGGDAVIFELPNHDIEMYNAITEARRKCKGRLFFYFKDDIELKEVQIK